MRTPWFWRRVLAAGVLLALVLTPSIFADEEPAEEEAATEGEMEPVSPEEARRLAKLLGKAARRRKASEVLPVLDEVGLRSHGSFHKPLLKMLSHASTEVALRAADMLEAQKPECAKETKKLVKGLWKSGWSHKANHRRYVVLGRIVRVMGTHAGEPLDARQFKDVEKMWRSVVGNPNEAYAPGLVDVCRYVRLTKDKRLCRLLAEEIDEPMATNVNSPSNPPASWWEARWKLWKQIKAEAVEALEVLTGQSFKDTAQAKAWFEENEREFGFDW